MYQTFDIDDDDGQAYDSPEKLNKKVQSNSEQKFASKTISKGFFNSEDVDDFSNQRQQNKQMAKKQSSPIGYEQVNLNESPKRRTKKRVPSKLEPLEQRLEQVDVFANVTQNHQVIETYQPPQLNLPNPKQSFKAQEPKHHKRQKREKKQDNQILFFDSKEEEDVEDLNSAQLNIKIPKNRIANQVFEEEEEEDPIQNIESNQIEENNQNIIQLDSSHFSLNNTQALRKQLLASIKVNTRIKMEIVRDNSLLNTFWPQFHLFCGNDSKYVMSGKKTSSKPTSTFIISCHKETFDENSIFYLGKMKSNIMGDILNIYGPGLNPSNAKQKHQSPRQPLATVNYITSFFQAGKPRQFVIYYKKPEFQYYKHFKGVKMYEDEISFKDLYEISENKDKILLFQNRQPIWKEEIGGYMLNFRGRVSKPSIKNFIVEKFGGGETQTILFGKVNENKFNVDLGSPFCPLVSFGVALSSFDSRIMCE